MALTQWQIWVLDIHPIRQPVHHKLKIKSLGIFFWSQFVSNVRPLTRKNKTFNSGFQNKECYFHYLFQQHIRVKKKHQNTDNELKKNRIFIFACHSYILLFHVSFSITKIFPTKIQMLCSDYVLIWPLIWMSVLKWQTSIMTEITCKRIQTFRNIKFTKSICIRVTVSYRHPLF